MIDKYGPLRQRLAGADRTRPRRLPLTDSALLSLVFLHPLGTIARGRDNSPGSPRSDARLGQGWIVQGVDVNAGWVEFAVGVPASRARAVGPAKRSAPVTPRTVGRMALMDGSQMLDQTLLQTPRVAYEPRARNVRRLSSGARFDRSKGEQVGCSSLVRAAAKPMWGTIRHGELGRLWVMRRIGSTSLPS